jgi:predicted RecB family nuclease
MPFPEAERTQLLSVKGVGPTVIARLEQMGIDRLSTLAKADAQTICAEAAGIVGSTCWKNSPQARKAIEAAIVAAQA